MEKVKIGIIGIGNMGTGHSISIRDGFCPELELVAVADRREVRRAWAQENLPGVQIFTEGEDLINSGLVDAIIIATPHYQHPTLAVKGFEKGLHVLSEKPAGVYTKAVREMNAAAEKSGKTFAMMFNQRTNCIYRKMKEIIDSGELGQIRRVNWIITTWFRTQSYYDSGDWRGTWDGEGGGVLLNQCPHQLDLLQWICGMPCKVRAFTHNGKWHNIEVEDDVTAYLEYPNGATGVFVTTTGDYPGTNRFEVTLDGGKLICENDKLTLCKLNAMVSDVTKNAEQGFGKIESVTEVVETDGLNPQHRGVLNAFAGKILRGTPLVAEGCEGINGLTLSNAMHLSSWTDSTVTLPLDEDLFLEELTKRRESSCMKKTVSEKTFDTAGTY